LQGEGVQQVKLAWRERNLSISNPNKVSLRIDVDVHPPGVVLISVGERG